MHCLAHELADAAAIGCDGILRLRDGAADDDVVRADLACLCGRSDAHLIVRLCIGKADAGGDGEEVLRAGLVDAAGFKRGADHAVEPGESCVFGVVDDHFLKGAVDADLFLHALLAGGGELRDSDEHRTRTVRAGESLKRGAHHGVRTCGVEVDHVHIEGGEHGHRFFHGVGDVVQLEIEEAALKKEEDHLSKQRLADIQSELAELKDKANNLKAKWENEKAGVEKIRNLKEEIEKIKNDIQVAQRNYDLNKAAELQYGKLPAAQKELELAEQSASEKERKLVHEVVSEEEISEIVSKWTGIPVAKLTASEKSKTLNLADELHKRVVGQDEAVEYVSDAIIRSKAGIKDPSKPIGSFLFLGPTGVGKTELAKTLAEALFDNEQNMVRIDMSEYMEKYSVSRLIGAPPGYVGYDEGGQLTEAVRRKPYSVVLFDEVEKAHPDVFNVLLQVLDDGRITDSQGRTVDFKNTIIIMTSNIGGVDIAEGGGEITDEIRETVMNKLKQHFRPEFLNRIDETIIFKSLSKENIGSIVDLMVKDLNKRLAGQEITIKLTDEAKSAIIDQGYDPVYGARPLKRFIQKNVETLVARMILAGEVSTQSAIIIDYDGQKLTARNEK